MGLTCSSTRLQQLLKLHDKKTQHCIYAAIRHCDGLALARHLLSQTDINVYNAWGVSPLHVACEIGDEKLVAILVAMGADVELATRRAQGGTPPLVLAATHGRAGVVRTLLQARAAVNAADRWGCTPLFKAASYNHLDCVHLLLEHGADPDTPNCWGAIPLQYAAHQGHYKVVRALTKHRCDVQRRGEESVPPALVACAMRGYHRSVESLLAAGAHVDACYDRQTALCHAVRHCQHALSDVAANSGATLSDRLRGVQALLEAGAAVTAATVRQLCVDDYFPSFVHEAAQAAEAALVRAVVRALPATRRAEERGALRALLRQVAMTLALNVPLMTQLARLVCSVGLNPTRADVDALHYALSNDELAGLQHFSANPRSLMDNCRLAVRANLPGNVLARYKELPLPESLKDYVTLRCPASYSL